MDSNKKYWKGLEELNQTPAFVEGSKGEFAESIPVEDVLNEAGLSTKTPVSYTHLTLPTKRIV